jgi:hypothetical protein
MRSFTGIMFEAGQAFSFYAIRNPDSIMVRRLFSISSGAVGYTPATMPTDQLFKALLKAFLQELIELFLPQLAPKIDFQQVEFLDKELYTDTRQGNRREPDLVAKVNTHEGIPEILLLHCEIQAKRERGFPYRMFEYYALLRLRHQLPVYPIALYLTPNTGGLHKEVYEEHLFEADILRFEYEALGLPDLSADEYLERGSPLASALSALMHSSHWDRVHHKLQSLRRVAVSEIDEGRKSLLVNVIESCLQLSAGERVQFNELVEASEEVREMLTIYEERGIEKGIEQGIIRGKREVLLRMMRSKFGELPDEVIRKLENLTDNDLLDELSVRLLIASTLEEMDLEAL